MANLTKYQFIQDSKRRSKILKELGQALLSKTGIKEVKVKAGIHQLAWIKDTPTGRILFSIRLVLHCPGVWRFTDNYKVEVPKAFWTGGAKRHLGSTEGFEWNVLPEEVDTQKVANLVDAMAIEGEAWDATDFGKRWTIFPENEHAHYARSVEAKKRADDEFKKQDLIGRPRKTAMT